jgi:hypothetical protein
MPISEESRLALQAKIAQRLRTKYWDFKDDDVPSLPNLEALEGVNCGYSASDSGSHGYSHVYVAYDDEKYYVEGIFVETSGDFQKSPLWLVTDNPAQAFYIAASYGDITIEVEDFRSQYPDKGGNYLKFLRNEVALITDDSYPA